MQNHNNNHQYITIFNAQSNNHQYITILLNLDSYWDIRPQWCTICGCPMMWCCNVRATMPGPGMWSTKPKGAPWHWRALQRSLAVRWWGTPDCPVMRDSWVSGDEVLLTVQTGICWTEATYECRRLYQGQTQVVWDWKGRSKKGISCIQRGKLNCTFYSIQVA